MIETNELSKNAMGGTELMMKGLYEHVDTDFLKQFQIIPSRTRRIDDNRKTILYLHDLPGDPEVQHLKDGGWEKYDQLVFVSHWQQQMYNAYLGVPYSAGVVLRNAIMPIETHTKPKDKIRLIYTSTPHRGLDILYVAFNELAKHYDNVELNVYSSFNLYGWPQRDEPYGELFDRLRAHPQINYHGSKPNDEIREALKNSHILAYPSVWQETSCLCLIEAMSAGCLAVHSSLAALPETSMSLTQMYQYTENVQDHANLFYSHLKHGVDNWAKNSIQLQSNLDVIKQLTDSIYSWDGRKQQWINNLLTISKKV